MPKYFKIYLIWAIAVILLVFAKDKFSTDNIAHFFILVYLGFSFLFVGKKIDQANAKKRFIVLSMISAAVVEGFYMIQMPVFASLRFVSGMSLEQMFGNYAIDLVFTLPAYYFIFRTIWYLINKYQYNVWQYTILIALGQGLGDGSKAFLGNPGLFLFVPYVLINYQAMSVVPFLRIKHTLPQNLSVSKFKYIAPIVLLPLVYILCGLIIYSTASFFNLK